MKRRMDNADGKVAALEGMAGSLKETIQILVVDLVRGQVSFNPEDENGTLINAQFGHTVQRIL